MKKTILFFAVLLGCLAPKSVSAQLKVAHTGNVGIHLADTVEPLSSLSIGGAGYDFAQFSVYQREMCDPYINIEPTFCALNVLNESDVLAGWNIGMESRATLLSTSGRLVGILSSGYAIHINNNTGRSFGVYGKAGGTTSGWNYGVLGTLQNDEKNGAAICGNISGNGESSVPGRLAGYFKGQTRVEGDFYANTLNTTSDARLKDNVADVERDALQKISELHPVQFNWKPVEDKSAGDTATVTTMLMSDDTDYERMHYGLLAQEVKALFPELVHEDANGYMSVNYVELIPLLIQAVQNLSEEVAVLRKGNTKQAKNSSSFSEASLTGIAAEAVLLQNTPNPFTTDTKIEYILPQTAQSAYLYIYNMNGVQVQAYTLNNNGKGEVIVSAGQLEAGMYFYSLIVDNSVVDTKRMILTK